MKESKPFLIILSILILTINCSRPDIDQRSYNLGVIGAFAEIVDIGIKELALSAPLTPSDMDDIIDDAMDIAARNNVNIYREKELLVTDLFSSELTEGKHVLLICNQESWQKYIDLKDDKDNLIEAGKYNGFERDKLARRFGKLLSYPDERINKLLEDSTDE